ncbi:hypothetical protein [Enterococcus xiangfangensis]|uniref:hypothetical protein n=1 Tax=Enterococcus xiangfangensis TaxID=1296537 RepID=UPI003D18274D|nr:hypothetical protein [Enterococcus asini]
MDLTKEAIKFMTEMETKPYERIVEMEDGRLFAVNTSGNVEEIFPHAIVSDTPININTLSGLVNYIQSNIERIDESLIVHIADETRIHLMGTLEIDGRRELLATANAIVPRFSFNSFMDTEEFSIALQSKFVPNEDRQILLQVVGNVSEENVKNTGDDGVSQAVTINQGVASKADVKVPNPVVLEPYRTFLEVEQPESQFIFRMKDGPRGAIFEADGGAWRNQAIVNIREYLKEQLSEEVESKRITILA